MIEPGDLGSPEVAGRRACFRWPSVARGTGPAALTEWTLCGALLRQP